MYTELNKVLDSAGCNDFVDIVLENIPLIVSAYQTVLDLRQRLSFDLDFDERFWEACEIMSKFGVSLPRFTEKKPKTCLHHRLMYPQSKRKTDTFELEISDGNGVYFGSKTSGQLFRKWEEFRDTEKRQIELIQNSVQKLLWESEAIFLTENPYTEDKTKLSISNFKRD